MFKLIFTSRAQPIISSRSGVYYFDRCSFLSYDNIISPRPGRLSAASYRVAYGLQMCARFTFQCLHFVSYACVYKQNTFLGFRFKNYIKRNMGDQKVKFGSQLVNKVI